MADTPYESHVDRADSDRSSPGLARLMLVEGDPMVRRVLVRILEDAGYLTAAAASPAEALELASSGWPADLIILDLHLYESDDDVCESVARLRRRSAPAAPKVIVTATRARPPVGGTVALRQKPFDADDLLGLIERHLPGGRRGTWSEEP